VDRTKNVSGVLRALKTAREAGVLATLDVIGDGPDATHLKELASSLGLTGHVIWHGRLSNAEVLDRMATTGTVIINSNVETFSVVTGEALALGKPVIATRCGGPQAFVNESNGILIEPRDDKDLAQAMSRMASGTDFLDPAAIRRTISDRFSPQAVADGFITVYQRVLAA
jgi:glycosyltransferase involved in cell wall biosynthesis